MTLKVALSIIIPVLEKVITQMSLANQTPEQRVRFNRLKAGCEISQDTSQGEITSIR